MEKKTEIDGIYKVTEGILINKDNTALQAYKKRKMQNVTLKELEKDVISMKDDIKEIKDLLRSLVK
jgi:hypothetical protein